MVPAYLLEVHKVPVATLSWMTGIPLLIGIPGLYLGGWLTDFITLRLGSYKGRCVVLSASRLLVMLAFGSCIWLGSPWLVTAAMVLVSFGTDLGTPAFWAYSQDVGGRHVGLGAGLAEHVGQHRRGLIAHAIRHHGRGGTMANWTFLSCLAFLIAAVAALGWMPAGQSRLAKPGLPHELSCDRQEIPPP